jgi:hypothetical protein
MPHFRHALATVLCTVFLTVPFVTGAGAHTEKLGSVRFENTCSAAVQADFNRAVALLHSFAFAPAIRGFEAVAASDPGCGIARWGAAVAWLGNPLAGPVDAKRLAAGAATIARATSAGSERERDYIAAIGAFYKDHDTVDHKTRALAYEKAMEAVAAKHPNDTEAAIFYALALNVTLNPSDKTYANQLKAAAILEKVFAQQPDHPGVAHYLIHSYDFPPIAPRGLAAAKRYASIAPSAPHALHMPSHIFTRLGHWEDSIQTNLASADSARAELREAKLEAGSYNALHAWDYVAYAALQIAREKQAASVLEEVRRIDKLDVEHFAAAFAFAAIPARYALERRQWSEAATLELHPKTLSWQKFPQAESIVVFARGLGAARGGDLGGARRELAKLEALRDRMTAAKNTYWADQAEIQRLAVAGWIARAEKRDDEAVALLRQAAEREDATEKHPVTPGAIQPAREMLAEALLETGHAKEALAEFERSQRTDPNRYHGLAGAARAAEAAGDHGKAKGYYEALIALAKTADTERPEIVKARAFVAR